MMIREMDDEIRQTMIDIIENDKTVSVTLDEGGWCSVDSFSDIMEETFFGCDRDGEEDEYCFSEVIELEEV